MKKLPILVCMCLGAQMGIAADLIVEANAEYVVNSNNQVMTLDTLVLGDNSRISFAGSVQHWSLNAAKATIGDSVVINGRGADGNMGEDGASWGARDNCGDGRDGEHGQDGNLGKRGLNITLNLGLNSLGSLSIDTSGGAGGRGGQGGTGEDAGSGKTCSRADGGNGGNGGAGGAGGNGGELRLSIWTVNSEIAVNTFAQRITTMASKGLGGAGGQAGIQGQGSPSQMSTVIPSVTGGRRRVHAGDDGKSGEAGMAGPDGSNGIISISTLNANEAQTIETQNIESYEIDSNTANESSVSSDKTKEEEIKLLRQQLEALQQRLEQLEKQ